MYSVDIYHDILLDNTILIRVIQYVLFAQDSNAGSFIPVVGMSLNYPMI